MARPTFVLGPLSLLIFAAALSAQAPTASTQPAPKVDFARDVQPILQQNCVSCHGPLKQRAGMRLDRKSSALKPFTRRIIPGSSANSILYHRLNGEFGSTMPPDGALKPDQISTIKSWIEQGAEWPDALANEDDPPAPNPKALTMVESLRTNDLAAFLRAAKADPTLLNARGPEGSTPFMYAVLYSTPATLTRLLALGADPNRHNDANATALMWAASNLEKTRLLILHGADVNAKSSDLRTPLMIASRHPGGAPIVTLLLAHGANPNPNSKPEIESSPLLEALTAGDPDIAEVLLNHGADAKAAGEAGLSMAGSTECRRCFDLIASRISDKNVFTASLQDIAVYADLPAVTFLLDHGADVKAFDPTGRTALMYAAVSDLIPVDVIKLLIAHGADVNAVSKHTDSADGGQTVLDMARHNGETAVVRLLLASGAKSSSLQTVALTPRLKNEIRLAIQDSIPLLQSADANFANKSGCISCHNNSLTAMTVSAARKQGFTIDEKTAAAQVHTNVEFLRSLRDRLHQGFMISVDDNFSNGILAYMLIGLNAENYKPDLDTDAAAMDILSQQQPDGQWFQAMADGRPPLCLNHIGETALSMRALQLYAPKMDSTGPAAYRHSIQIAATWLANAHSFNNDDRSWRVAGLAWASGTTPSNKPALQQAIHELLTTQRPDGSWSDLPTMESTAYATGKSLVALHLAGLPVSDPVYQRGIAWLLAHQEKDGSWYVQTRALGFQPYFDAGFPHAHDQWISAAGTNWGAMALTLALPESKNVVASRVP